MIRTLVVDDLKFMRTLIADMLVLDPKIDMIATAKDGEDAVAKARLHHPDVITLDVEMSRMDELEALRAIMDENPTPVVMLSALTQKGADTLEALRHGAVDFVPKPSGSLSLDIGEVKDLLISRIKAAALAKPGAHPTPHLRRARTSFRQVMGKPIIVIGTSTGSHPYPNCCRSFREIFRQVYSSFSIYRRGSQTRWRNGWTNPVRYVSRKQRQEMG